MVDLFSAEQPVWRLYLDGCTEQRACAFQTNSGRDRAVDRHMPSQRGPGGRQHVSGRAARLHASPAPSAVPERPVLCLGRGLQCKYWPWTQRVAAQLPEHATGSTRPYLSVMHATGHSYYCLVRRNRILQHFVSDMCIRLLRNGRSYAPKVLPLDS